MGITKDKFEGFWLVKRSIIRRNPDERYYAMGIAFWSEDPENDNRLLYHEKVKITQVGDSSISDANQKYKYEFDPGDSGQFIKYYDKNPCKYTIDGKRASGEYKCGDDSYKGIFDFKDEDHFALTYKVSGPKKDYSISTEYSKCNYAESAFV